MMRDWTATNDTGGEEAAAGCAGVVIGLPLVVLVGTVVSGHVLATLWGWFVVPLFHLAPLTWYAAAGLAMVVGFTHQRPSVSEADRARGLWSALAKDLAYVLFKAALYLAAGATLHHWWPL